MSRSNGNRNRMLPFLLLFTFSLLVLLCELPCVPAARASPKPCKSLVLYFHDILYNGKNAGNATSAIVGAPAWGNLTILAGQSHFGDVVVFDDPITTDNNLHSPPVGRALGLYLYDEKQTFCAWMAFTFVLNSTQHKGTINFAGPDPSTNKTRQISVIGGSGDFFMTRGIATLETDALEVGAYFRLRTDIIYTNATRASQ